MNLEEIIKFGIIALVVLGVAWAPVACTMSNNNKIETAIDKGVDPAIARCAYAADTNATFCALAVQRQESKP